MKMRIASLSLLTILCFALSAPAFAQQLYNNGPTNGNNDAYFIDVYQVSDSFTVSPNAMISGFTIAEWVPTGETPLTIDWAFGTSSFGSDLQSGTGTPWSSLTLLPCPPYCGGGDGFGYSVWLSTSTFPYFNVAGGPNNTYWLTLTGATDNSGGRDAWDINSGPSMAYHNLLGSIPSESFTINGTERSTTPEPSSILLFGSGILGLAGVLRRKLF
jgi:hypothetical protein